MNSSNSFYRQYEALYAEALYADTQSHSLSGAALMQMVAKKTRILDEMVRLCAAHGRVDYQRHCERARTFHAAKSANSAIENVVVGGDTIARRSSSGAWDGNSSSFVPSADVNNKLKKATSSKNRLANVEAETLDQVNDKKVAEKSSQLDRVFVKLETMTRLRGEDSNKYPRQSSVIITVSECNPNAGGGNRTKLRFAEDKRRSATLVVVRSVGGSMLRDGTLKSALLAAAAKLNARNVEHTESKEDKLDRQDRFDVEGSSFDVAVALDWKTYFQHVFAQQSQFPRQNRKEKHDAEREQNEKAKVVAVSSDAVGPYATSLPPPPLFSLLRGPPTFSSYPVATGTMGTGMQLAESRVNGITFVGTQSSSSHQLSGGRLEEEAPVGGTRRTLAGSTI